MLKKRRVQIHDEIHKIVQISLPHRIKSNIGSKEKLLPVHFQFITMFNGNVKCKAILI